jgi:hypothetical protein
MKRLAQLMALVASLVLLSGATAAFAGTRPDDLATHGSGAVALEQRAETVRPDDRATHGQGAIAIEQMGGTTHAPVIAPATAGAGFHWLDAVIGAAAALGLCLIVAGGVALVVRRNHAPAYS